MIRYFADPKDTRPGTAQSAESVRNTPLSTMRGMGGAGVKTRWGDNMIIQGGGGSGRGGAIMQIAKFVSLNSDGNTLEAYVYSGSDFASTTTTIYKPMVFQESFWNGKTLTFADGTEVEYDVTDLDKKYQRRANWTEGGDDYSEVQEITEPYWVDEWLYIITDIYGNKVDMNNAGRHWAVNGDVSP